VSWIWLPILLLAAAIAYWLVVLSEGVYLGNRAVIALYDWGASSYDRIKNVRPEDDALHLAGPLLSTLTKVTSPLILDVATGTGRLPLALLRQWDFRGRVVGLDRSRRMLAIARRRTYAQRERVGWLYDDAMALPFPDGLFRAVTCIEAVEFLPHPREALREMVRALAPGGRLMVSNRVGTDAFFLPGRACQPGLLEERLRTLGLIHVRTRRWQVHYDLVEAEKPPADEPA
jgi:SAM-dependent methyltransferase